MLEFKSVLPIFLLFYRISSITADCSAFLKNYEDAKSIVFSQNEQNLVRESRVGANFTLTPEMEADVFTITAKFTAFRDKQSLITFSENAVCLNRTMKPMSSHAKYRSFDGSGNNLKNPFLGAAYSPYGRLASRSYDDKIYSMRKSFIGSDNLPNPRDIVEDVLKKARKKSRNSNLPNIFFLAFLTVLPLDIGNTPPRGTTDGNSIQCCTPDSKDFLPEDIRHQSCIPFSISRDDYFFKNFGVRCMNVVRSDLYSKPSDVQFGEIRNTASSYVDLSAIYGETTEQSNEIRTLSRGQLRLSPNQTFPMNSQGQANVASFRFIISAQLIFFATIILRHHNMLADSLANLNPSWNDEKLFQEARKINIGIAQNLFYSSSFLEIVIGEKTLPQRNYDETVDPSNTVEFMQGALRFPHFFNLPNMTLIFPNGSSTQIPTSDLALNVMVPEFYYDDSLRGALKAGLNLKEYNEEMQNKVFKNKEGFGFDVFGMGIQRGRDHGLPTWLQARKFCGLSSNFEYFNDLLKILPYRTVKLLEETYESVVDIDLIVGGSLESFGEFDKRLLGPTFSCIFREQYNRFTSGDAYFFTHKTNPNPFTPAQLSAVKKVTFNDLICVTSKIEFTNQNPLLVESPSNPKVKCSGFKFMDLTPWIEK